jgi:Polysaccharide pyruvyl transferase
VARALAFINPSLSTTNVGDLFIEDSVKRILVFDRQRSIDIDPRRSPTPDNIAQINATDAAVIVGTNLWYRRLPKPDRWRFTLDDLKRIRVPIIPLGVGTTRHASEDNGFEPDTLAQIRWIHEQCPVASARDWRTVEALAEAGIRNVSMTGCPTLYRSLSPIWRLRTPQRPGRVVVTVRKGQRTNVRLLLRLLAEAGLGAIVAGQQPSDAFIRPWPLQPPLAPLVHAYDVSRYLALVESSVGAIGWRLHGNMLHLAHGNPAVFYANCSRAESFCRSFGLPCVVCPDHARISESQLAEGIERLFDPRTFASFGANYAYYRGQMADFLDANGLEHRLHGVPVEAATAPRPWTAMPASRAARHNDGRPSQTST